MPQRPVSRATRIAPAPINKVLLTRALLTRALLARVSLAGVLLTSVLPAASISSTPEVIRGAGATFPAPLYIAWAASYRESRGVRVEYEAVGSGKGIDQVRRRTVDFGASDAPLAPEDAAAARLVQFPAVIGGVVPVINISGIEPGQLVLDGAVLADVYLGRIHKWNDPQIVRLNPTLALPNTNITVVHRGDASGSSLLWTDYLARSSVAWQQTVGTGLEPRWPVGVAGVGNEGVAAYVQRTRFAIGYVEYAFARAHRLSDIALRNRDGHVVRAGYDAFEAAGAAASWDDLARMRQMPTDLPGARAWPITGASFILLPEEGPRATAVLEFFDWALHSGDSMLRSLDYAPLPRSAMTQLSGLWERLRDANGRPSWPRGPAH